MDSQTEIIKQLIDSITSQLTMILMKIEGINPVLTRIHDDVAADTKIDQTTLEIIKSLETKINDFKNTLDSLPRAIERIEKMETELLKVKTELISGFNTVKTKLEPVYEVNSFLSKFKSHVLFWIAVLTTAPSIIPSIIIWLKSFMTNG